MHLAFQLTAFVFLTCVLLCGWAHRSTAHPMWAMGTRWALLGLFSTAVAAGGYFVLLPTAPLPLWVGTGLVATLFLMTAFYWIGTGLLSKSPLPLFPRYQISRGEGHWPTHPMHLKTKQWLGENGFTLINTFEAQLWKNLENELAEFPAAALPKETIRTALYTSANNCVRAQIVFLPHSSGGLSLNAVLLSQNSEGGRIITDNIPLPYGGYYPPTWQIQRQLFTRSIAKLHALHIRRLTRAQQKENWQPEVFTTDPLDDLNAAQAMLEAANIHQGFMHTRANQAQYGQLTAEGRYRLWKALLALYYVGYAWR